MGTFTGLLVGVFCTDTGVDDGIPTGRTSGEEVGARTGVGEGLVQFGGCIGMQVGYEELPIRVHTVPGSQQSVLAMHLDE